jgi:hypothetical protein
LGASEAGGGPSFRVLCERAGPSNPKRGEGVPQARVRTGSIPDTVIDLRRRIKERHALEGEQWDGRKGRDGPGLKCQGCHRPFTSSYDRALNPCRKPVQSLFRPKSMGGSPAVKARRNTMLGRSLKAEARSPHSEARSQRSVFGEMVMVAGIVFRAFFGLVEPLL